MLYSFGGPFNPQLGQMYNPFNNLGLGAAGYNPYNNFMNPNAFNPMNPFANAFNPLANQFNPYGNFNPYMRQFNAFQPAL